MSHIKPIERQIAEGDPSKRGKKQLERKLLAAPKPAPGLPKCPKHLEGRARELWVFLAAELNSMRLDKRPDATMLEGACIAYSRAVDADLILNTEGILVYDKCVLDGEVVILKTKKHPAVEVSNSCWLRVKAFCCEFGLSPVSRTRLTMAAAAVEQEDDLAAMLAQPRPSSNLVQ